MRWIRKTIFWLHLVVGLVVGLGVALMAGTGMVMAFEHPIVDRAERFDGRPPTPNAEAWSVENLLRRAQEIDPASRPTGLTFQSDPNAPAAVPMGRDRVLYLNAYTGEKVGTEATRLRAFFKTTEDLHRWLALSGTGRDVGKNITGAVAIGFLVLIISGLWLWMPRVWRWPALRAVMVPSGRLRGKARDWNWHNAFGFWLLLPLLVITLTGLVIAYPWANALIFRAVGEAPPAPREQRPRMAMGPGGERPGERRSGGGEGRPAGEANAPRPLNLEGLNDLWFSAQDMSANWTSITMRFGGGRRGGGGGEGQAEDEAGGDGARGGVSFIIVRGDANVPTHRTTLTFDRRSGELTRTEAFADQPLGRRLRSLVVPIHRGEVLGTTGRVIAVIACAAALMLVYTGFALSWRRLARPVLARRRARRAEKTDPSATFGNVAEGSI
ncbi:MAG: peptidase [Phycisphaerales bacterium]|nr:peptidase [Phycisphaerales bacterium]